MGCLLVLLPQLMYGMLTVSSVFELEVDFYNCVVDLSMVLRYLFSQVCASSLQVAPHAKTLGRL